MELVKFEQLNSAAAILDDNKTRVDRAMAASDALYQRMLAGMNDDIDAEAGVLMGRVKKTLDFLNEQRKPITQALDAIKKEFTGLEALIDAKQANSTVYKIQALRNQYATQKLEEARKKEAELLRLKKVEEEMIAIKAVLDSNLIEYVSRLQRKEQEALNVIFSRLTTENARVVREQIEHFNEEYSQEHFDLFQVTTNAVYLSRAEVKALQLETMAGKYEGFAKQYKEAIIAQKQDILARFDSRLGELKRIAEAGEADRQRLIEAKEEADRKEQERLRVEAAQRIADEKAKIEANRAAEKMQNLFDMTSNSTPQRTGYSISVNDVAGYAAIYMFWLEKEGRNLPFEKIEKTSIAQMKAYCEKHAHKHEECIVSPFLNYSEVVKAK